MHRIYDFVLTCSSIRIVTKSSFFLFLSMPNVHMVLVTDNVLPATLINLLRQLFQQKKQQKHQNYSHFEKWKKNHRAVTKNKFATECIYLCLVLLFSVNFSDDSNLGNTSHDYRYVLFYMPQRRASSNCNYTDSLSNCVNSITLMCVGFDRMIWQISSLVQDDISEVLDQGLTRLLPMRVVFKVRRIVLHVEC